MNCETRQDGELFPHYGVAPHICHYKIGKPIGESEILPKESWSDNFIEDSGAPGLGVYHCPDCWVKLREAR